MNVKDIETQIQSFSARTEDIFLNLAEKFPMLLNKEFGYIVNQDTKQIQLKIGDGITAVAALPFVGGLVITNPALTATNSCFTWSIDAKVKPSYVNIYSSAGEQVRCDITLTNTGATVKMYRSDITSLTASSFYAVVG